MTTIDELLTKGITARPDLKSEMEAAADLVKNGRIRIISAGIAECDDGTAVYGERCYNRDHLGLRWCCHTVAVRMAKATGQEMQPLTEEEKEQRCEERARKAREDKHRRLSIRGENNYQRQTRKRRNSGEGARAYIRMATANGATTIPEHIVIQAQTGVKVK